MPRWFEIAAGDPMFNIIPDPVDFDDMVNIEYDESEVIAVATEENGGDEEGVLPEVISITLAYFQIDQDNKAIILVEMEFDELQEVSEEQFEGIEDIYYNITFTLLSFSHRDLTL